MSNTQWRRTGMNKEERRSYVSRRADELARSGQHRNWLSIEFAIRAEGFSEARQWLDDSFTRKTLDGLCAQAQGTRNA